MSIDTKMRDYSIIGQESEAALQRGVAAAEWYKCPIPRAQLLALAKRRDWPGIRDTVIWFAALIASGFVAWKSWGTWWAAPAFLVYGTLYASASDLRWHECGHRTAFKTPWLNDVVYQIASFCAVLSRRHGVGAIPATTRTRLSSGGIRRSTPSGPRKS